MRYIPLIAAVTLIAFSLPFAGGVAPAVTGVWTIHYDGPAGGYDEGKGVAVGPDGSVYITGDVRVSGQLYDILVSKYSSAGGHQWTRTYNGAMNDMENGNEIAVGPLGNIHVVGNTRVMGKSANIFVGKYDPSGNELWVKKFNRTDGVADSAYGVAVADNGAVYVTGYSNNLSGSSDMVLLKYNKDGTKKWTRFHNPAIYGHGVAIGPSGKIYVTGNLPVSGHASIMVAKYSTAGRLLYAKGYRCPNSYTCSGYDLAVDSKEKVYVTGGVSDSNAVSDIWVGKFTKRGSLRWSKRINGNADKDEYGYGITVDSANKVYVAGRIAVKNQEKNVWLRKYNPNGTKVWTTTHHDLTEVGNDVAVHTDGSIYVVGTKYAPPTTTQDDIWLRKYVDGPQP
jgi:uncharacterized delta-60 repeat protein